MSSKRIRVNPDAALDANSSIRASASALHRDGYVVIASPFTNDTLWHEVNLARREFPEYLSASVRAADAQQVLGGFGALGNPASFHHPTVRNVRRRCKREVVAPVLFELAKMRNVVDLKETKIDGSAKVRTRADEELNTKQEAAGYAAKSMNCAATNTGKGTAKDSPELGKKYRVEALFDRLCVRCKKFGAPGQESWHRDSYDFKKYQSSTDATHLKPLVKGDVLFGGWINCNSVKEDEEDRNQYFSCVPGTQDSIDDVDFEDDDGAAKERDTGGDGGGFNVVRDVARMTSYESAKRMVVVPPGHVLIMQQSLVHEIAKSVPGTIPSIRLFLGHRLTKSKEPLFDETTIWIQDQAVPRIPSGQHPPMFSSNHYAAVLKGGALATWGEKMFKPEFLHTRITVSAGRSLTYKVPSAFPHRGMDSLRAYGRGMCSAYTDDDIAVMKPEKKNEM